MTKSWNSASTATDRELAADAQDSVSRNVRGAIGIMALMAAFLFAFYGYLVPWMTGTAI